MKILESSQILLNVVKTKSTDLQNCKDVKTSTSDSACIKSTSLHWAPKYDNNDNIVPDICI